MVGKLRIHRISFPWCIALFAFFFSVSLLNAQDGTTREREESGTMIRLLCVRSLIENEEIILASKTEDGEWMEHEELKLRSPFINDWI